MNRKLFLLLFWLIGFCSLSALAQSYYEFSYKDKAGKLCYGFMIYESDDNCSMRIVQLTNNQEVTAAEEIKYVGQQGVENGQQYTALCPEKEQANAPNIVFFWNKLKGSKNLEIVPALCFDLEKDDFQDPESFTEVGLSDITTDYLQQFYSPEEETYKSIFRAQKEIVKQREQIAKNLGDGSDIFRAVMDFLAENGVKVDVSTPPATTQQNNGEANVANEGGNCANVDNSNASDNNDGNGNRADDAEEDDDNDQGGSADNDADDDDNDASDYNQGNNLASTTPNAAGVTLHFVSVINSNVSDIGASCERDYDNFLGELKGIAQALGIQFKNHSVMGDYYSREAVAETLSELRPGGNDIVFFYYSGHGFRFDDQQSQYPAIALTSSSYDDITRNYLLMSDIYDEICSKNARLNIVLSDCCNTPIGVEQPAMRETGTLYGRANNNFSVNRLGQLFLQERGNLLSTAASPGETSICDMTGGFFTIAFIRSLRKEINATNAQDVSWNNIINNTISSARQRSSDVGNIQHGIKETTIYR